VDFRNCVVIMTSNIGAEMIRKAGGLGFAPTKEEHSYEDMKGKLLDEAKRVFKPEFMNRLDDMIVFHNLNKKDMEQIVHLEVAKVKNRMKFKDVEIHLTPAATDFLIEKGYDPQYGARPLRRAVEKYLQDPLAEEILRGSIKPSETVEVVVVEDKLVFNQLAASAS
jgi:ATP-dependent Clp protease ATP-binding subunit ClpC